MKAAAVSSGWYFSRNKSPAGQTGGRRDKRDAEHVY